MSQTTTELWPDPADPEWRRFCETLDWLLGSGPCAGGCEGSTRLTRLMLDARGYDADASLELYEDRGAWCDCEVLLNLGPLNNPRGE